MANPQPNISQLDGLFAPFNKLGDLKNLMWAYQNWYDIVFGRLGLAKQTTLRLREHPGIKISGKTVLVRFKNHSIKFHVDSQNQLQSTYYAISEIFMRGGEYAGLDVHGKDVIDIGANIGDTAIYFALNGARHVDAYEPHPYSYGVAKKNIKLNNLGRRVSLYNKGIAVRDSVMSVDESKSFFGGNAVEYKKGGKRIELLSLKSIAGSRKGLVLKMDCEGYEYQALLNSEASVLKRFDSMMIEYHYGYLDLEKKLTDAGFRVTHTRPRKVYYKSGAAMYVGIIHAKTE